MNVYKIHVAESETVIVVASNLAKAVELLMNENAEIEECEIELLEPIGPVDFMEGMEEE